MRFIFITVLFGFGRAQEALVPSAQLRQCARRRKNPANPAV
jgi:hypothetical protein